MIYPNMPTNDLLQFISSSSSRLLSPPQQAVMTPSGRAASSDSSPIRMKTQQLLLYLNSAGSLAWPNNPLNCVRLFICLCENFVKIQCTVNTILSFEKRLVIFFSWFRDRTTQRQLANTDLYSVLSTVSTCNIDKWCILFSMFQTFALL